MKLSADKWRARWSDDTAFYSYRWFAWALAGLALTLPGRAGANLPREAGLLLLLGVITVAATAMAQGYVRLARQRPIVLLLDVLAGLLVVWLSGGGVLPFMPYALGALLLPALLGGWRGALIAGLAFTLIDSLVIQRYSPSFSAETSLSALLLRAAAPLAYSGGWLLISRLLRRGEQASASVDVGLAGSADQPPAGAANERAVPLSAFADREPGAKLGTVRGAMQPARPAQIQPASRSDAARHAIFDLVPGDNLVFSAALEQLRLSFSRQGSVEIHLTTLGVVRPLNGAQHSVLLRVAQEALMNVHQHAHASTVQLTLAYEPHAVILAVQDDGVGLLDGTYERPGMHALRAVRYRLAELDGHLSVFEGEQGGVVLRATMPLS